MNSTISRAVLGLVVLATPLAAQITARRDHPGRGSTTTSTGDVAAVLSGSDRTDRIPPGQLPPRGMCRLWIDNVPPGHQPAVTDCATAERQRLTTANSHVIYGDVNAFPGKGKYKDKLKNRSGSALDRQSRGDDDDEIENDRSDRSERATNGKGQENSRGHAHGRKNKGHGD
ncbi:MAG TPA: hypothetical protein VJ867_06050 [Gemmatimonadaceae bacterium]|nr:hypothetical protein [Gemmatimonadaceae bacterium]